MLSRSGDSGHLCLIPDCRENGFSFSPLSMMLAIGLSYIAFTMLSYFPCTPSFLRAFIMKWCWILLKAFCTTIDMIKWFLSLLLLMCCITYRFAYVDPPLHPWDEANLVMVNDLSNVFLDSVCHYIIEDFSIDVH
jgi:hypothetical protein